MQAPHVRLRPCGPGDAASLALVGAATFLEAFAGILPAEAILTHTTRNHSVEYYARHLADGASAAWLVEALPGEAPVGYALTAAPDFDRALLQPGDTELRRIYVFSRFREAAVLKETAHDTKRQAPGQSLMEAAIRHAQDGNHKRLLLGVHRENERALAFYRRNGFKETGTRRFQLGASVFDDLVLARNLS